MNTKRITEIARANASEAVDQRHEYTDSFASYWDNVVSSLYEEKLIGSGDRTQVLSVACEVFSAAWDREMAS